MNFISVCAVLFILSAYSGGVYSTIKSVKTTKNSHPMLASVLNIVDNIRQLEAQASEQNIVTNSGKQQKNCKGSVKANGHQGIKRGQIDNSGGDINPAMDKTINRGAGSMRLSNMGIGMMLVPDNLHKDTLSSKSGSEVIGRLLGPKTPDRIPSIGLTTDMLCALCRQQGDAKCIKIHCWNDGSASVFPEVGQQSLESQLLPDSIPGLSDNFGITSQIDRHDLLQLTAINSPPEQNSLDMIGLNHPPQDFTSLQKETTAPIWLMANNIRDTVPNLPVNNLPVIQGSIDLIPVSLAEKIRSIDTASSPIVQNGRLPFDVHQNEPSVNNPTENTRDTVPNLPVNTVPVIQGNIDLNPVSLPEKIWSIDIARNPIVQNGLPPFDVHPSEPNVNIPAENPGDVFAAGNLGSLVPPSNQHTTVDHLTDGQPPSSVTPLTENSNNRPLEIPTETLIQMVRSDGPSFTNKIDVTRNQGNPMTHRESAGPQTKFVDPSVMSTNNVENSVISRKPLIPLANDVFANSKDGSNMGFPAGFVEENTTGHNGNIETFTSVPHIPTAGNIFPEVRKETIPKDKHRLVIKEHGNKEKIAVFLGSGPIPDTGISLLETRGQRSNVQPIDMQSLTHDTNGHNHQNVNHQNSPEHSHQTVNHQNVDHQNVDHQISPEHPHQTNNHQHSPMANRITALMNGVQLGGNVIGNVHNNDLAPQDLSTTTPIPTIHPVRNAELQNWSKQLLIGVNL